MDIFLSQKAKLIFQNISPIDFGQIESSSS